MRACCVCGISIAIIGNSFRCPPCRRDYEKARRDRLKAEGKRTGGAIMPKEYHRAYGAEYFKSEENKTRRNARMRGYRNSETTREHHLARWQVNRAVASGRLVRQPCQLCGELKVEAHHEDYGKPLEIVWLCRPHHQERHAKATGEA